MGLGLLGSCARPAEPMICPALQPGDLVITELRGPQSGGADTYGQWFELFNATEEPVDLRGLQVRLLRRNGSGEVVIIVRAPALEVDPGAYVVFGHHGPGDAPDFVDYSFFGDFYTDGDLGPRPRSLYDTGIIQVSACGEQIDRVIYPELPALGSWAFDGARPPSASDNEDASLWCNDTEPAPADGPQTEIGLPGTPGQENRPC